MRMSRWALALAITIGCTEHRLAPTAPPDKLPNAALVSRSMTPATPSVPQPGRGDHILFDARGSLQSVSSLRQALKLFGYGHGREDRDSREDRESREDWAFTKNVDGLGTHALRIDWPGKAAGCATVSASLSHEFRAPYSTRVYFQWTQHMGRTANGGGKGTVGAFTIGNTLCSGFARDLWLALQGARDMDADDGVELEVRQASAPTVDIDLNSTGLRLPATSTPFGTKPMMGRDVVHTLYLQAESAPRKGDGIVRYWIDGALTIDQSAAKISAEAFRGFAFPEAMRISPHAQSEYFWNIVAWQPAAGSSSPPPITAIAISPDSITLAPAATQTFRTVGFREDATKDSSVSVTYSATGGSITPSGLYTAGASAGSYHVIATYRSAQGSPVSDTASVTITQVPTGGSTGDPSQLTNAAHQSPDFAHYVGGSLTAGQSYNDPVTGVRVWKITDAATPIANSGMAHDYSSGPVQVSRGWGSSGNSHTVLLIQSTDHWLVDFTRGQGISNWRRAPSGLDDDLSFTFAYDPATPRIAYYIAGTILHRYDTATNSEAPSGLFPKDLSSAGGTRFKWLQQDKNDEWFVMMPADQSGIIAWNSKTDQLRVMTTTRAGVPFNEPRFEKDGRFVFISLDVQGWMSWDLVTDTFTMYTTAENHTGGARHFFASNDPNPSNGPQFRFDPFTNTSTTIPNLSGAQGLSVHLMHRGDEWVMSDQALGGDLTRQWMLIDPYDDGGQSASWSLDNGEVYVATIGSFSYDEQSVGINSVRQYVAGSTSQYAGQLTSVASRGAMTEGSFYYDASTQTLYVWATGGGDPTGRVDPRSNGKLHDAVGLFRLDGSELKILAHHYELGTDYWKTPRATISADGKIVLFDSNMNNLNGRGDVFLVEVPIK